MILEKQYGSGVGGGGSEISLNCYNPRNIRKFVYNIFVTSSNMTSQYDIFTFFYSGNDQDIYPRQCAKFVEKMCKECKLALDDRF